jgi:multiple sugar transport system permease protein
MPAILARGGPALRSGATAALLAGAVFGALATLILGVLAMLAAGVDISPRIGAGAAIGMLAGLAVVALPQGHGLRPWLAAVVILLASLGLGPLLGPGVVGPDLGLWGTLAFVVVVAWLLHGTIGDAPFGRVSRYDFERLCIRLAKRAGLILFAVFVALPFYVMVMTSFKTQAELLADPLDFSIDLARGWGLFDSYVTLFTTFDFGRYILNSTIVATCSVIVTLAIAVPGAYAVARLRFRGREAFARSILLIYMVPAIVLVLPLYAVFSQLGLRNTLAGLLIVYPATTIPVALYMLQGYFRGLPAEMEEAGLMDGLSRAQVIRKITVPLSLPALASVGLYVFMIAWNEFLFAFMFLDDPSIFTLPRGVASLNSSELPRELMMAGAVISTLPIMAIFLWLERYMVQGLASGAVKG